VETSLGGDFDTTTAGITEKWDGLRGAEMYNV
jgi:hypothetical protein